MLTDEAKRLHKIKESLIITDHDIYNPTLDQVKDFVQKCTDTNWEYRFLYFALNVVAMSHLSLGRVNLKDGIYAWQIKAAIDFCKGSFFITDKPRQVGATSFIATYLLYRALFWENQEEIIISLSQRDSSDVLKRIMFQFENLPVWLKSKMVESNKSTVALENGSRIRSLPKGENIGRGISASVVVLDEFAFMDYSSQILASVIPTISKGLLSKNSSDSLSSSLFIISTRPLVDDGTNEFMRILNTTKEEPEKTNFNLIDIDVSDIEEYQSESWHKMMLETLGQHRYNVEVLRKNNEFADNTFIPGSVLAKLIHTIPIRMDFLLEQSVTEDGYPIDMDNFHQAENEYDDNFDYIKGLWIYHNAIQGEEYGIAADVGLGVGGDYSSFHVFNLRTYEQVAEYKNNMINTERYKMIILKVAKYYNNAKVSIENNSMGYPLCDWFVNTINYDNFFSYKISKNRYVPGLPINSASRPNVLSVMARQISSDGIKINSIRTINELKYFGFNEKKGRMEGIGGSADDLVMSLAQFCFIKEYGFFVNDSINNGLLSSAEYEKNLKKEENSKKLAWFRENFDIDEKNNDIYEFLEEGYVIDSNFRMQ